MSLRPQPSRIGGGVRIVGTVLIALHLFMSAWLVVQFEGQYTEGRPSPTKVKALVAIDNEQTLIDVKMENSTRFFVYMLVRDYDEPKNSTQPEPSSSEPSDDTPATTESNDDDIDWLKNGRKATLVSLVLLCLSECLVLAGIPFKATLRAVLFAGVVACFLVVMPTTYVLDLAGGDDGDEEDDDDGEDTIADETFVAQTEQGSMAHEKTSVEPSLLWTGIRFEMMFSGYDLGLVEPDNYSSVRNEIPEAIDTDSQSFVKFESYLDLKYGKNLPSMFLIPLLWFFFPSRPRDSKDVENLHLEQE
ncbi:MAG: hypothetical protein CL988_05310 [Euryarchaeota archaeon]|nr:hypothetical protein [Euryarchaeota archaeon]